MKTVQPAHKTNRLIRETSPYLLLHARNPVDWFPWGEEAFRKARREGKPVFLSIGYSACHWCHVMERESFENAEIADVLNREFVSVKVDREERPDVDHLYMAAVQMISGGGGWPLSVFLTADRMPFFGGTYFPPDDRYGQPGFRRVLLQVAGLWRTQPEAIAKDAAGLSESLRAMMALPPSGESCDAGPSGDAAERLLRERADREWGGFGGAPKFPPCAALLFLLSRWDRSGDPALLELVTRTLDRMAEGGIYDQLGGGFHRYSVDARWLVPHFEKMLYDNALLARVYTEAFQITADARYRRIATETLDYAIRDLTNSGGGFCASEDADSEGEEGRFYLWTMRQARSALSASEAEMFCRTFGVTEHGNFEGGNILTAGAPPARTRPPAEEQAVERVRRKAWAARNRRPRPPRDDKVIAAWNGLMLSALCRAHQAFGEERYLAAAQRGARFLQQHLMKDGEPQHTWRDGAATIPGYLDDYAEVANAFLDLYESTFDAAWVSAAGRMAGTMDRRFGADESAGYRMASAAHETLPAAPVPYMDGPAPSGNAAAAMVLLRLYGFTQKEAFCDRAERILAAAKPLMERYPEAFLFMQAAADFRQSAVEVAIAGTLESAATGALIRTLRTVHCPHKVVAWIDPDAADRAELSATIPMLAGKANAGGTPAAYVCRDFVCAEPVGDPQALAVLLRGGRAMKTEAERAAASRGTAAGAQQGPSGDGGGRK